MPADASDLNCHLQDVNLRESCPRVEAEGREELRPRGPWWSRSYREHYRVLIAAWTYVHAADLRTATEELPSYERFATGGR